MVPRPENLVSVDAKIIFNLHEFEKLEIDLVHINKNERSSFTPDDVEKIFLCLVENRYLEPVGYKYFSEHSCTYYIQSGVCETKRFKIVFCVCGDKPNTIGIITLHRI